MLRTEANLSIPDGIWRHNKGTIIDTLLPNHDPSNDCCERVWWEISKPLGHHCIWYDSAPNSYAEQKDPCIWLILEIPMT
jgi:hypothetical protein